MTDTDVLWGGMLTSISLDPVGWTLRAWVEVTTDAASRRYELVLAEVIDVHAERGVPLPWTETYPDRLLPRR